MAWCFSTRSSVATVLRQHPCISSCLGVNIWYATSLWDLDGHSQLRQQKQYAIIVITRSFKENVSNLIDSKKLACTSPDTVNRDQFWVSYVCVYSHVHIYQAIAWTNLDLSSVKPNDIYLRVISQERTQSSITKISLKIFYYKKDLNY